MDHGVKVRLASDDREGFIIRRIDASAYEIFMEDGSILIVSPDEFEELEKKYE